MSITLLAAIGVGGALGAVARYILSLLLDRWATQMTWTLPLGTLTVNLLGSFAFGLIVMLLMKSSQASEHLRLFLLTGFLGSFTTFSTFSFETVTLMQAGHWGVAIGSIMLNLFGCLLAFWLATVVLR